MSIRDTLATLLSYYSATKGVGHTQAVLGGAADSPDCLVLVGSSPSPTLPRIKADRVVNVAKPALANGLIGRRAPMVVDNSAMVAIMAESLAEIQRLDRRVAILQKQAKARGAAPSPEAEVAPVSAEAAG